MVLQAEHSVLLGTQDFDLWGFTASSSCRPAALPASVLLSCLPSCCLQMQNNNQTGQVALIRAYLHGYFMYSDDICTLSRPHVAPLFDTCDWSSECAAVGWFGLTAGCTHARCLLAHKGCTHVARRWSLPCARF